MSTVVPPDDTAELQVVGPDRPAGPDPRLQDTQAVDLTGLARMTIGWADLPPDPEPEPEPAAEPEPGAVAGSEREPEPGLEPDPEAGSAAEGPSARVVSIDVPLDDDPPAASQPPADPEGEADPEGGADPEGPPAVDPRIEARRAGVADDRRRTRRRVVASFVGLALAGAATVVALYSPMLDVDRIEIIGSDLMDRAQLADETGLRVGDPALLVDVGGVEARLRRDPRFARVAVVRELPDVISVRLTDRRPVARVVGPHRAAVVGEGGVVIVKARGDELLRSIEVSEDPPVRPGSRLPKRYADAVDVMGSMSYGIAVQIEKVRLTPEGELIFDLLEHRTVKFGTVADADRKLLAVRTMLGPQVDNSRLCELDVRVPSAPTIRRNPDCDPPPPPPDPVVDPATGLPAADPSSEALPDAGAPTTVPPTTVASATAVGTPAD